MIDDTQAPPGSDLHLKMMNFPSKMMHFVLKMMNWMQTTSARKPGWDQARGAADELRYEGAETTADAEVRSV